MSFINRVRQLPEGFVWGASTAAYQTEGATSVAGKGKTMWDDYLIAQGRFLPDPASDFYHRYEEDIRLAAEPASMPSASRSRERASSRTVTMPSPSPRVSPITMSCSPAASATASRPTYRFITSIAPRRCSTAATG